MTQDPAAARHEPPDASDVVEGPVGDANLRDPATSGPMGADLDALEGIETGDDGTAPARDAPDRERAPAGDR